MRDLQRVSAMGTFPSTVSPQRQQKQRQALSEWSRESTGLRRLAALLDREVRQSFYATRSDLQERAAALLELEKMDTAARRAEWVGVRKRLQTQKAAMSEAKVSIRRLEEGEGIAQDLDVILGELEDELYDFKRGMRKDLEQLAVREKQLSTEVDDLRGNMKDWETNTRGDLVSAGQKAATAATTATAAAGGEGGTTRGTDGGKACNQAVDGGDDGTYARGGGDDGGDTSYGEVVERVNALIRREGGGTGGWPQHEHDCFLRLWTQVNRGGAVSGARPPAPPSRPPTDGLAVASLVLRASALLPSRDASEVTEHLAWLGRYQGYLEEKRRLARQWREQKLKHKQDTDAENAEAATGAPVGPDERGKMERAEAAAAAAVAERERKRKEVEEWRTAKEAGEAKKAEIEERQKADLGNKADETKRRQRRLHEKVAAYRLEREREDNRRREVERMLAREQRVHSQADIEERAKRDVESARRRREEAGKRQGERQAAEDKKKAAASERWASVASDRTRLLRATKASRERVLEPEDLDDLEDQRARLPAHCSRVAMSGHDRRFVGRAVPSWRQGCLP